MFLLCSHGSARILVSDAVPGGGRLGAIVADFSRGGHRRARERVSFQAKPSRISSAAKNQMAARTGRMPETHGTSAEGALRWSVEQRLAFFEERLFWLGEVNRGDLIRSFGVSPSQASKDIARYLEHAPRGLVYDKSA